MTIPLFRLSRIRVTIDPSWLLIFVLVAFSLASGYLPERLPALGAAARWALAAALSAALFASVLAHEFAHALVARRRGVAVDEIMLFVFGGVAKLKSEPKDARSELEIAAAGPALSLVLGGALLLASGGLAGAPEPLVLGVRWLGGLNVALAIFNLVPGFPLDGGRILRAILWWRTGDFERATIGAARTGQVVAGLLIATGVGMTLATGSPSWLWEALIGWFLWSAAARSIRFARLRDAVEGIQVRQVMTARVPAIRADHDVRVGLLQAAAAAGAPEIAVVERDGTLVGVVTPDALREAAEATPDRHAREVARPAEEVQLLAPGDSAETLVERLAGLDDRLFLVVEGGRLLGTIDGKALARAVTTAEDAAPA